MGEPMLQLNTNPCIPRSVYKRVKVMAKVKFSVLISSTFKFFVEAMKISLISSKNKIQNLTPIFVFQIFVKVKVVICDNQ